MGTMSIPDRTGHTAQHWRAGDDASVAEAARCYDDLVAQRLVPFGRPAGSVELTALRAFDPEVDEIVWVRPLQGG